MTEEEMRQVSGQDLRRKARSHRRPSTGHSPGIVAYLDGLRDTPVKELGLASLLSDDDAELQLAVLHQTDLSETEKHAIIKAHRGQGLFKERVALVEPRCRITGIDDPNHLRASRGFISFSDLGDILISPKCSAMVLAAWGISPTQNVGPFRPAQ